MTTNVSLALLRQIVCKGCLALTLISSLTTKVAAQVKIGDFPNTINPNSLLELESPNKGLRLPRVVLISTANASPLATHVEGMVVYNTSTAGTAPNQVMPGYYFNNGTAWVRLSDFDTQPWFDRATKTAATANTQNVYLMGKVSVGTNDSGTVGTVEIKPIGKEEPLLLRGGNELGRYDRSQISFGWNGTNDFRHSIRTRHDTGSPLENAIEFYLWDKSVDAIGGRTKDSLGSQYLMSLIGDGSLQVGKGVRLSTGRAEDTNLDIPSITINPVAGVGTRQFSQIMDGQNDMLLFRGADRSTNGAVNQTNKRDFASFDTNAPANSLTMSASGNIGIGTNSPTEKLEVNGSIKVTSVMKTSDRRLKTNIRPVTHTGELVNKLNPVHYIKTSPGSGEKPRKEYGFIAQEIRELLPELVSGMETDSTYLSLDYISLISILTKALQEQQTKTSDLTSALQEQQTDITDLKDQVALLVSTQTTANNKTDE